MSSSRRMDHMTWPEIEASKSKPVIVPIGSTEQHSQHLPLGVDAMIASHVSEDLAERIDGIVAPTMNYGYKSKPLSGGGPLFPGTIDMNGVTVINQMHDVLGELIADGFTKIVVMNAHFENEAFIIEAIDLITRETRGVATIVETNWWDPLPENVVEQVFDGLVFPGWALEHAAVTETLIDDALRAGIGTYGPCDRRRQCHTEGLRALPGAQGRRSGLRRTGHSCRFQRRTR